jgi:hypothetical protein
MCLIQDTSFRHGVPKSILSDVTTFVAEVLGGSWVQMYLKGAPGNPQGNGIPN